MTKSQIVFAGAGDLALRAMDFLAARTNDVQCLAVSRSEKTFAHASFLQGDLTRETTLTQIQSYQPKVIVVTLVPNGEGAEGYRRGYIEPLQALINHVQQWQIKPLIIFASSTGVYHQTQGESVDEDSATEPTGYSGTCMLEAEQLLMSSSLSHCIVRLGGIYGPGRDFLIRQVEAGKGGGPDFTNRIHQEDAGRCLGFLVEQYLADKALPGLLLACDNEPVPSQQVRVFIAERLQVDKDSLKPSSSGRGGNKRCMNARLMSLGFTLNYPTYREGYGYVAG